ncbi:MAG: 4-alpha-glucanotransferase [Halomonadaceae bacterium]|nr:MAG: 4-alpha-glucanotransferase [Halomonadaceae bacterium]
MSETDSCWWQRQAGVLLHPTSLPAPADLGSMARHFIDFLDQSGFRVWQMLPVGPVHEDGSPYLPLSSFAGDTRLISISDLQAEGLINDHFSRGDSYDPEQRQLLAQVYSALKGSDKHQAAFSHFKAEQSGWLTDYALFRCLRRRYGNLPWYQWPDPERHREPGKLAALGWELEYDMGIECLGQYLFSIQWQALRQYAAQRGIRLFGDLPIHVAHDSADVWCRPDLFDLDVTGQPREVAGVPPDAFADDGQRWGNPLYRWDRLEQEGFQWWIDRLQHQIQHFDLLRLDHFRGFEAYWAIPVMASSAAQGHWRQGPGEKLFAVLSQALGPLPLVAEDLGDITPAVESLRRAAGFPGMRVLQFAFEGSPSNPHRPHNHTTDTVVYTGTHDNDTSLGWWQGCSNDTQGLAMAYLAGPSEPFPWPLIRAALSSVAALAIIPAQDLLGLGSEGRMNTPGTVGGNWQWQLEPNRLTQELAHRLHHALVISGRAG